MLIVTEQAVAELVKVKESQNLGAETFVRVGIFGGGCSGFKYNLEFSEGEIDLAKYTTQEVNGLKIVVDKKSDLYLDGTTLDFINDLSQRGFKFSNPTATKTCGCGSSFSV